MSQLFEIIKMLPRWIGEAILVGFTFNGISTWMGNNSLSFEGIGKIGGLSFLILLSLAVISIAFDGIKGSLKQKVQRGVTT